MEELQELVQKLIKEEYRNIELVFEDKEGKVIVYEYIEPFIREGVQDDHKGRLNEVMTIEKENGEITGYFSKKEHIKEQIKNFFKKS